MPKLSFTFIALVGLAAGCSGQAEIASIAVAHIAPATRLDPISNQQAQRGILLAVEEANKNDGLGAGRRVKVLQPDCPPDPQSVRAAATRLATIDKVIAFIGGADPILVEAMAQVAESAKLPVVAPTGAFRQRNEFVFHTGNAPPSQGELLARFGEKEFPERPVAIIVNAGPDIAEYSQPLASAFARELQKSGGKPSSEWTFQTVNDRKELLSRIEFNDRQVAFLAGTIDDMEALRIDQALERIPILAGIPDGAVAPLTRAGLKQAVLLATAFHAGEPQSQEFVRKFEARFGQLPDVHAALAYDSARLLFDALRNSTDTDGAKVRDALAGIRHFDSVTGKTTIEADRWTRRLMYVVRIEKGDAKVVATVEAPRP